MKERLKSLWEKIKNGIRKAFVYIVIAITAIATLFFGSQVSKQPVPVTKPVMTYPPDYYGGEDFLPQIAAITPAPGEECYIYPAPGGTLKDTFVSASFPDTNYGTSTYFQVNQNNIALFDFGLIDPAPPGTTFSRAAMVVQIFGVDSTGVISDVFASQITAAWDETTVTYNSFANAYSGAYDQKTYVGTGEYMWDVTTIVSDWLTTGNASNYGIALIDYSRAVTGATGGTANWKGWTKEGDPNLQAYLQVCFQGPTPTPTPTPTPGSTTPIPWTTWTQTDVGIYPGDGQCFTDFYNVTAKIVPDQTITKTILIRDITLEMLSMEGVTGKAQIDFDLHNLRGGTAQVQDPSLTPNFLTVEMAAGETLYIDYTVGGTGPGILLYDGMVDTRIWAGASGLGGYTCDTWPRDTFGNIIPWKANVTVTYAFVDSDIWGMDEWFWNDVYLSDGQIVTIPGIWEQLRSGNIINLRGMYSYMTSQQTLEYDLQGNTIISGTLSTADINFKYLNYWNPPKRGLDNTRDFVLIARSDPAWIDPANRVFVHAWGCRDGYCGTSPPTPTPTPDPCLYLDNCSFESYISTTDVDFWTESGAVSVLTDVPTDGLAYVYLDATSATANMIQYLDVSEYSWYDVWEMKADVKVDTAGNPGRINNSHQAFLLYGTGGAWTTFTFYPSSTSYFNLIQYTAYGPAAFDNLRLYKLGTDIERLPPAGSCEETIGNLLASYNCSFDRYIKVSDFVAGAPDNFFSWYEFVSYDSAGNLQNYAYAGPGYIGDALYVKGNNNVQLTRDFGDGDVSLTFMWKKVTGTGNCVFRYNMGSGTTLVTLGTNTTWVTYTGSFPATTIQYLYFSTDSTDTVCAYDEVKMYWGLNTPTPPPPTNTPTPTWTPTWTPTPTNTPIPYWFKSKMELNPPGEWSNSFHRISSDRKDTSGSWSITRDTSVVKEGTSSYKFYASGGDIGASAFVYNTLPLTQTHGYISYYVYVPTHDYDIRTADLLSAVDPAWGVQNVGAICNLVWRADSIVTIDCPQALVQNVTDAPYRLNDWNSVMIEFTVPEAISTTVAITAYVNGLPIYYTGEKSTSNGVLYTGAGIYTTALGETNPYIYVDDYTLTWYRPEPYVTPTPTPLSTLVIIPTNTPTPAPTPTPSNLLFRDFIINKINPPNYDCQYTPLTYDVTGIGTVGVTYRDKLFLKGNLDIDPARTFVYGGVIVPFYTSGEIDITGQAIMGPYSKANPRVTYRLFYERINHATTQKALFNVTNAMYMEYLQQSDISGFVIYPLYGTIYVDTTVTSEAVVCYQK